MVRLGNSTIFTAYRSHLYYPATFDIAMEFDLKLTSRSFWTWLYLGILFLLAQVQLADVLSSARTGGFGKYGRGHLNGYLCVVILNIRC